MMAAAKVFSADFANKVMTGLLGLVLIRYLQPAEFAYFALGLSAAYLSNQIIGGGFNRIYILVIYELNVKSNRTAFLILQILVALTINLLFLPMFGLPPKVILAALFLSLVLCGVEFIKTIYQSELQFSKFSLVEFTRTFLFASVTLALILTLSTPVEAWMVLGAQAVTAAGVSVWPLLSLISRPGTKDWRHAIQLARSILAGRYILLFIYFCLIGLHSQTELVMLRYIGGVETVASFGAAFRYYAILAVALNSLHTVLAPLIQEVKSQDEYSRLIREYRKWALMPIAVVVVAMVAATWIIPLIDNGKYPASIAVFRVLACAAVISLLFSPFVHVLIRLERFGFLVKLVGVAWAFGIGLNAVLIPLYGPLGAAMSLFVSSFIINFSIYRKARGECLFPSNWPT